MKTATINIRIDATVRDNLNRAADAAHISVSELLRRMAVAFAAGELEHQLLPAVPEHGRSPRVSDIKPW